MKYFAVLGVQPIRKKLQHGTGKYTVASFVQFKQTRTQEACTRVAETWVGWNTFISVSKRDVFMHALKCQLKRRSCCSCYR